MIDYQDASHKKLIELHAQTLEERDHTLARIEKLREALEYIRWPGMDRDHWDRVNRAKDTLAADDLAAKKEQDL